MHSNVYQFHLTRLVDLRNRQLAQHVADHSFRDGIFSVGIAVQLGNHVGLEIYYGGSAAIYKYLS